MKWQQTMLELMKHLDSKGDTVGVSLLSDAISEYLSNEKASLGNVIEFSQRHPSNWDAASG